MEHKETPARLIYQNEGNCVSQRSKFEKYVKVTWPDRPFGRDGRPVYSHTGLWEEHDHAFCLF